MTPTAKINIELFNSYVEKKLINRQEHPKGGLYIWNYTPNAQFSRTWDEVTLQARGLITDLEGNIVARPFRKFFNYEEHMDPATGRIELPDEPFVVREKMDGSLGILYFDPDGLPCLATRGSFTSEQAIKGTHLLNLEFTLGGRAWLKPGYTYLFEIIYPENRIVVDYGGESRVTMLAVIDTATGQELDLEQINYSDKVKSGPAVTSLVDLATMERPNAEGFVITFKSGLRIKMKHSEYVRLHRLVTGVSTKSIWAAMAAGTPMEELLDRVPDEFYKWVRETQQELIVRYDAVELDSMEVYEKAKDLPDRRAQAEYIKANALYPGVAFALLSDKHPTPMIWKLVKPTYSQPFKKDIDA